jgi:hypothetical protein
MEHELEEQINDLIHKATKDLKTRILRVVVRHQNKLLKEQAKELKSSTQGVRKQPIDNGRKTTKTDVRKSKKETKYHSDSESDGYSDSS